MANATDLFILPPSPCSVERSPEVHVSSPEVCNWAATEALIDQNVADLDMDTDGADAFLMSAEIGRFYHR